MKDGCGIKSVTAQQKTAKIVPKKQRGGARGTVNKGHVVPKNE